MGFENANIDGAFNRRLRAINEKQIAVGKPITTRWRVTFPAVEHITPEAMLQVRLPQGGNSTVLVSPLFVKEVPQAREKASKRRLEAKP